MSTPRERTQHLALVTARQLEFPSAWNLNDWLDVTGALTRYVGVNASAAEAESINGRLDWYVTCLRDVRDGRTVRGLDEAKAGYGSALEEILRLCEAA